jgi:hypothetical protein
MVYLSQTLPDEGDGKSLLANPSTLDWPPEILKQVTHCEGRISISLDIQRGATKRNVIKKIQSMHEEGNWEDLDKLGIWRVQVRHLNSEDSIKPDGYCGYVAIDALMTHSDNPNFNHSMVRTVRDRG